MSEPDETGRRRRRAPVTMAAPASTLVAIIAVLALWAVLVAHG
jgi:hypothetical protein